MTLREVPPLRDVILERIRKERVRQEQLLDDHHIPWDCASREVSDFAKLAVLAEEFGEVARAVLEQPSHVATELIQVAAVATAWAESLIE